MRSLWAGLLLLLCSAPGAFGQATGYVRDLGFGGAYRPDCWTPLLVHLDSSVGTPAEYQIQVHQQDLDQDAVVFTRTVTLGPQARDDFWVYFLPQPTNGGLRGGSANARLGDVLKVHLYANKGRTHVAALPVQARADDVEQPSLGGGQADRGTKVVLVLGGRPNVYAEYPGAQGTTENVRFIPIQPDALPDHVLGYQAVDAVLWLNADWNRVRSAPAFTALQQWVRRGGHLAVCQPADRSQLEPLADSGMLPVVARTGPGPSAAWAIVPRARRDVKHLSTLVIEGAAGAISTAAWEALDASGRQFEVFVAQPRADAMVDAWVDWPAESSQAGQPDRPAEQTPLVVRRAYGTGAVTWVAQNLGADDVATVPDPLDPPDPKNKAKPRRTLATNGWPRIWDKVFGWRNQTRTADELKNISSAVVRDQYAPGTAVDLGLAVGKGTEHAARSTAYVFVAILFFVGYWVVAGPGSYLFLAHRRRKGLSWTVFGASALAATVLTVLVVKLLLGGGPELRHVSVVRLVADAPAADGSPRFSADVFSRVGLYIPKDGGQRVAVPAPGSAERFASVGPYAVHPDWLRADTDAGFTDTARYVVDTDAVLGGKAPEAEFFFRSTLKKVQAQWSGQVAEGVTGSAALLPDRFDKPISGRLTNKTGRNLRHVYFAFTHGWRDASAAPPGPISNDRVLYLPGWDNGTTVDLAAAYAPATPSIDARSPGGPDPVRGRVDQWAGFWYRDLPAGYTRDVFDDRGRGYTRSHPLMSLVDRAGPAKRRGETENRPEPVRRGFRDLDVSPLVSAGRLVVFAQAPGSPVPLPMDVNGDRVGGEGTTFYQISLPLDREQLRPVPGTQPATRPASGPATKGVE